MARKYTTKYKSNKQEKEFAKAVGGRVQIASGALWHSPSDVRSEKYLIECKTTAKASFAITQKHWEKIQNEALHDGLRIPILNVQLLDGSIDLIVMSKDDFLELGEKK